MRQRRWLELVKYYDCDIRYHLGKVNIVMDAISRKVALSQLIVCKELHQHLARKVLRWWTTY